MANQLHVSWLQGTPAIIIDIVYFVFSDFVEPVFTIAFVTFIVQIAKQENSTEGKTLTLDTYFKNFHLAGKGIGNYWWTYLWEFLWGLLAVIPVIILLAVILIVNQNNIPQDSSRLVASIIPFVMLLCIFPLMIYKVLSYCMNTYAIADINETGVIEAMNISKAITKGHRGELLGFYLSFFGWYVLEIITLGIAALWVVPYIRMSVYNFYKELSANYKPETPESINAPENEDPYSLANSIPKK